MMRHLISVLVIFFLSAPLFAAEVTKVKGQSSLIELKGETAKEGDLFYTLNAQGKRVGLLRITKISGEKAIAKILKGRAEPGMVLLARKDTGSKSGGTKYSRSYLGVLLGFGNDTVSAQVSNGQNASLSGFGIGGMAMFDYRIMPQVWFRGLAGVEGFNVSGSSICGPANNQACTATIYYLGADFMARYLFSEGSIRPWLGLGFDLLLPATKSSSAIDSSSISDTYVIQIAGGADFFLSPTFYIPVSIEYGYLPKSASVTASWIELRLGVGFPF